MENGKLNLEDFAGSELSGMQKKMIRGGQPGPKPGDDEISDPIEWF